MQSGSGNETDPDLKHSYFVLARLWKSILKVGKDHGFSTYPGIDQFLRNQNYLVKYIALEVNI